jgi:tryptophan synthase alpha chain
MERIEMSTVTPGQRLAQTLRDTRRERCALVAFLTAGYPSKALFREHLMQIAANADVVEIGVPFSDPMADGVTIQRSSEAALKQGVSLHWILDELSAMPPLATPLVLMGYYNPLLAYGLPALAARAASVGVCGFIVPDLPPEESAEFEAALRACGLALIRMVTPVTPPERLATLCRGSEGFVYAVTMTGVTGANAAGGGVALPPETLAYLKRVRDLATVPVCAGFGIRSNAQVKLLDAHVDGVIVGSALVEALEKGESAATLLQQLRGGPS